MAAYSDQRWWELYEELGTYSYEAHIFDNKKPPDVYRKGWEWTQTVYGLERPRHDQATTSRHRCRRGRECVIFWLGDRLRQVVATDLYGNEAWTVRADGKPMPWSLRILRRSALVPIVRRPSSFALSAGTDLSHYGDDTFDVAWSLSSIEHFGGHARAGERSEEMARVVRPAVSS